MSRPASPRGARNSRSWRRLRCGPRTRHRARAPVLKNISSFRTAGSIFLWRASGWSCSATPAPSADGRRRSLRARRVLVGTAGKPTSRSFRMIAVISLHRHHPVQVDLDRRIGRAETRRAILCIRPAQVAAGMKPISTRPISPRAACCATILASSTCRNTSRARSRKRTPASVIRTWVLPLRSSSRAPSSPSSFLIWCVSVGGQIFSRSAAREKCCSSASATK